MASDAGKAADASGSSPPDAGIVTTACDQMRRIAERIAAASPVPVFLMHVPTTWQTVAAHKMYLSELKRLGRFLVELGGRTPSNADLAAVMRDYDKARSVLRDSRGGLSAWRFSEAIAEFHRTNRTNRTNETNRTYRTHWQAVSEDGQNARPAAGRPAAASPAKAALARNVPLALVGGPLVLPHFDLFDLVESAGGEIVLDATESGERTLPAPFDRRALGDDPLLSLAEAYFGTIPDAFRRPNSALYAYLKREIEARGVRGILFRHYVWCDTWRAEAQRLKEWAGVPLLLIEVGDEDRIVGHEATRIASFLEMLK